MVTATNARGVPTSDAARAEHARLVRLIWSTKWGRTLGEVAVRAVAEWCRVRYADPLLEVDWIDGGPYLNAVYYRRLCAPVVASGRMSAIRFQHVGDDPRLAATMRQESTDVDEETVRWAKLERGRRLRARISYDLPEEAPAAVIASAVLVDGYEIFGTGFAGLEARDRTELSAHDLGKAAETRAEQRLWLRAAAFVPEVARLVAIDESNPLALEDAPPLPARSTEPLPRAKAMAPADYGLPDFGHPLEDERLAFAASLNDTEDAERRDVMRAAGLTVSAELPHE